MKLLIINPGGTSTKIAVFEDEEQVLKKNIIHTQEELSGFSHVFDQFGYRKGLILKTLEEEGVDIHELSGVAGRGGLMNPIPGGTYRVTERMLEDLEHAVHGEHLLTWERPWPEASETRLGCRLLWWTLFRWMS